MNRGFTLIELLLVMLVVVVGFSWVGNLIKLTDCDFEAPYRCEVLHGVGLVPVIAPFTVFVGTDN